MKKLFYLISMVCLLASCNKDPEPEPIVVTNDALTGTWVYDNAATGVTEILKFTPNGGFYYTTVLADAAFAGYSAGNYSIADNVNVTAVGVTKSLDFTVTKLKANSFTAKDNSTGESRTYSKLVETLQLLYLESDTPGYSSLVAGNISSYKSHNEKVATVDKTGAIKAVAEGITLIDVVASEGTAVVLVKAEGLIPDYAKAIGYVKDEVLAEYGEATSAMDGAVIYISPDNSTVPERRLAQLHHPVDLRLIRRDKRIAYARRGPQRAHADHLRLMDRKRLLLIKKTRKIQRRKAAISANGRRDPLKQGQFARIYMPVDMAVRIDKARADDAA